MKKPYKTVLRWVVTHQIDADTRTLTFPSQGRYTDATQEDAQGRLDPFQEGLRRVLGDKVDTLRVLQVECWEGHHDPCGTIYSAGKHYDA